jgi:hypothetical protein
MALADPETHIKEAYADLKTQCYYRYALLVNTASTKVTVTKDNWLIDGERRLQLKRAGRVVSVEELIRTDLKAVKRAKPDAEKRLHINSKEEQKILLSGRSPDFGDMLMMRCYFDVRPRAAKAWYIKRVN